MKSWQGQNWQMVLRFMLEGLSHSMISCGASAVVSSVRTCARRRRRSSCLPLSNPDAGAGDDGAVAIIKASLDPGTPVPTLDRRVTWYFYDENLPTDPLIHVASNLAHRLALPGVKGKKIGATNPKDFIVFSIPITSIDDPRKPRFTDSGELRFLEVWRPGGKTAPWIAGCLGLDEAVGAPTILATSISDVRSTQCYEP